MITPPFTTQRGQQEASSVAGEPKLRMVRPLEERVAQKLTVGGFLFLRTEQDNEREYDIYGYAESEQPDVIKYELPVCAGAVLSCQCEWYRFHGHCAHQVALARQIPDPLEDDDIWLELHAPQPAVNPNACDEEERLRLLADPLYRKHRLAELVEDW